MQTQKLLLEIPRQMLLLFIVVYCVSCSCDDKMCKGLEDKYAQWIPANQVGDSIRYVNANGDRISFGTVQREIPVEHIADCHSSFAKGCTCEACVYNDVTGYISYVTSDTRRRFTDTSGFFQDPRSIDIQVRHLDSQSMATLRYSIFDHSNNIMVSEGVSSLPNPGDSLLPSFTIGARTYSNVVVHQVDTTINNPADPYPPYNIFYIYKSWFNKEYGVIAFYDLLTQSLYYRE